MFFSVSLKINHPWFWKWVVAEQATSHYPNLWWYSLLTDICVTRPQRVNTMTIDRLATQGARSTTMVFYTIVPISASEGFNTWNKTLMTWNLRRVLYHCVRLSYLKPDNRLCTVVNELLLFFFLYLFCWPLFYDCWTEESQILWNACHFAKAYIEGILSKGPYLPCVSLAGRALLAGYPRYATLGLSLQKLVTTNTADALLSVNVLTSRGPFY